MNSAIPQLADQVDVTKVISGREKSKVWPVKRLK